MMYYKTEEGHPVRVKGPKPVRAWTPVLARTDGITKEYIEACRIEYKRICAVINAAVKEPIK